jgi:hypothetical protein
MTNITLFTLFLLILAGFFPQPASAYFDPGTTGSLFTVISSIMPAILAVLGFLFFPIRRLIQTIKSKVSPKSSTSKKEETEEEAEEETEA